MPCRMIETGALRPATHAVNGSLLSAVRHVATRHRHEGESLRYKTTMSGGACYLMIDTCIGDTMLRYGAQRRPARTRAARVEPLLRRCRGVAALRRDAAGPDAENDPRRAGDTVETTGFVVMVSLWKTNG